jgi:hypothetical protein
MMRSANPYETATMAKVFASQGYLRQAARIYRCLLERNPQREDLADELATVEHRIAAQKGPSRGELGLLIREWADLIRARKKHSPKLNKGDLNDGKTKLPR